MLQSVQISAALIDFLLAVWNSCWWHIPDSPVALENESSPWFLIDEDDEPTQEAQTTSACQTILLIGNSPLF